MKAKLLNSAARWLILAGMLAALPAWADTQRDATATDHPALVSVAATSSGPACDGNRVPDQRLAWDRVGAPIQSVA